MRENEETAERLACIEDRLASIQITLGTIVLILCAGVFVLVLKFFGWPAASAAFLFSGIVLLVRLQAYKKSSDELLKTLGGIKRRESETT